MIEKDWITAAGLRAVVRIHESLGHRCGYVGLPPSHTLYGVSYSDKHPFLRFDSSRKFDDHAPVLAVFAHALRGDEEGEMNSPEMVFEVHGGLTYSSSGTKTGYPLEEPNDLFWYGYDCGHAGDAPSPEFIAAKEAADQYYYTRLGTDIHRTLEYCIVECESLARQLAAVSHQTVGEEG